MTFKFRAHETFFIRKGWLNKGMKNVEIDPYVFMGANENPMDRLGIGSNMVKSLRYWLQAVGLTCEPPSGRKFQEFTDFGKIVYENDRYFEELGTLWLLQYKLANNRKLATSWYYFFNEFILTEFTKDDFIIELNKFIISNGTKIPVRTLEDDFNCIINTYIPRIKSNPSKVHPESNIDCPLGELGLIDIVDSNKKIYRKATPKKNTLDPLILLAVIVDQFKDQYDVKISAIQNNKFSAGKVFNLDIVTLIDLLYQLDNMGFIKVERTAGLDVIRIKDKPTFIDCIEMYYKSLNS
jgi:hypothetical protein